MSLLPGIGFVTPPLPRCRPRRKPAFRRRFLELQYDAFDVAQAAADLGIIVRERRPGQDEVVCGVAGQAVAGEEALLGLMTQTFRNTTLECRCRSHGNACKLMVSVKRRLGLTMDVVRAQGAAWLAAGSVGTAAQHSVLSSRVRREIFQMRV